MESKPKISKPKYHMHVITHFENGIGNKITNRTFYITIPKDLEKERQHEMFFTKLKKKLTDQERISLVGTELCHKHDKDEQNIPSFLL